MKLLDYIFPVTGYYFSGYYIAYRSLDFENHPLLYVIENQPKICNISNDNNVFIATSTSLVLL